MSVAPAPGTCCRQSWGKAELATRPGAWAALERGQLKQPRLDLPWVREMVVAPVVVVVVRNAVVAVVIDEQST